MDLKSLPVEIRSHIRSGINISCFGQCVTELVLNCLDAKATAIAVRINFLKFKIQVVDNGRGISESNMNLIGVRYMTNKCRSLNDFKEKFKYYGYRGEFLASVKELSKKMLIMSKSAKTNKTCSKLFENNVEQITADKQRAGNGTTVTIEELFYNQPVRQRRVNSDMDADEIKRCLEWLSVIHPNVSFSLRNDVTGNVILNCHKTKSVAQAFANLYPNINIDDLHEIKVIKDNITISGLIYTKLFENNKLQLIYVNKRPVHLAKIQKLMNDIILKKYKVLDRCESPIKARYFSQTKKNIHLVYVLNIMCPYSEVEFILNSTKCLVDFKSWNIILKCIHKMLDNLEEKYINIDKCLSSECNKQIEDDSISLNEKKRSLETVETVEKQLDSKLLKSGTSENCKLALTETLNKVEIRKKTLGLRKVKQKEKRQNVFEEPITLECLTLDVKNDNLFRINHDRQIDIKKQTEGLFDDDVALNLTFNGGNTVESNSTMTEIDKSNNMVVEHNEKTGKDYIMDVFIKSIGVIDKSEKWQDLEINIYDKDGNNEEVGAEFNITTVMRGEEAVTLPEEPNILHDVSFINVGLKKRRLEKINSVGNIIITNKLDSENKNKNLSNNVHNFSEGKRKSKMTSKYVHAGDNTYDRSTGKLYNINESNVCLDVLKTNLVRNFIERGDLNVSKYFETSQKRSKMNDVLISTPPVKRAITEKDSFLNQSTCDVYESDIPLCTEVHKFGHFKPTYCTQETKGEHCKTFQSHYNILKSKITPSDTLCTNETYDELGANNFYKSILYMKSHLENNAKRSKNKIANITINSKALAKELSLVDMQPFPTMQSNKKFHDVNYNKFKEDLKNKIKYVRTVKDSTWVNLKCDNDFRTEISESAQNITSSKYFLNNLTDYCATPNILNSNIQRMNMNLSIGHIDTSCLMRENCDFYPQIQITKPFENINDENTQGDARTIHSKAFPIDFIEQMTTTLSINETNFNAQECDLRPSKEFERPNLDLPRKSNKEQMEFTIHDLTFRNFLPQFKSTQTENICVKLKPDFSHSVDTQIGGKQNEEWINQMDTFGSLFYLNTRTGMTSYANPMFESNFTLKKRVELIPKGLSPILVERKQCDKSLSPSSRKKLTDAVIENYQRELNTVKWEKFINNEDSDAFFANIYNEKCKQCEGIVPDISKSNLPDHHKKRLVSQTFTKDIFADLHIIGQMDCKFIVTLCKSNLLILFDQHAVHERIRLEALMQEYAVPNAQGVKTIKFKSITCKSGVSVKFLGPEMSILMNYKPIFENVGLTFDVLENEIVVRKVPACFYKKSEKLENNCEILKNLIRTLINEEIEMIQATRGLHSNIPECLLDVINSEACRGAIKFGEQITREECIDYITKLSNCNLPFQCAHGRPTLVPILLIEDVRDTHKYTINLKTLCH